jgi:fucose permease
MAAGIALLINYAKLDSDIHTSQQQSYAKNFGSMLRLLLRPLVCVYVLSAFVFVLIEQSIGTWLPTFNNEILKLPLAMSVQVASIFAASCAVGRLCASVITRRISWYPVVNICILSVALLIVMTLPLTRNIAVNDNVNWFNAPVAAYIFPLLGFFLAPIYPCINSVMLTSLPKYQHAAMTGLLVIFSALGGTTGSLVTGYIFGKFSGQTAFYLTLAPILMILLSLYFFKRSVDKVEAMLNPLEGAPDEKDNNEPLSHGGLEVQTKLKTPL